MADVSALPVQDWGSLMSSYGNAQSTQNLQGAQAGLVGQQTQAAAIQNQIARMRLPLIQKAITDFSQQSDQSGTQQSATQPISQDEKAANWYDPARVDAGLRQRFFQNPAGTPDEIKNIIQAGFSGDNGLLEAAKAQRELGVQSRVAQSQSDANQLFETMSSVNSAPDGQALTALGRVSPQAAEQIRKLIPDGMEEDAAARQYASHVASTVHQYSGREVVPDTGGTYRDKVTGMPISGVPNSGMNQEQWTNLANHMNEPVDYPNTDGSISKIPRFKAEGYANLQAGILGQAAKMGAPGAAPTVTGAPKAAAIAAAGSAAAKAPATAPTTTAPAGVTPGGPISIALGDKSFRIQAQPIAAGRTQSPEQLETVKQTVKQRGDLQEAASENASAASQALASFKAAKAIMNAPDGSNLAGVLPGALYQEMARLGFNTDTGSHRIEAAKYLTNGALQNLKTVYGAKPGVFDVKVNLEQAFPNVKEMNDASVKDLIDTNIRNSTYLRDSAARVPMYLQVGNRPTDFNTWNEKYFPRAETVNQGHTATTTSEYKTPDDVKAAYQAGKITRDQAKQILQSQHGMK